MLGNQGGALMAEDADECTWHEIVRDVLKRHNVGLVTYVPDNLLRPLIGAVHADPFFTADIRDTLMRGLGVKK
jgi:hypothetical protein